MFSLPRRSLALVLAVSLLAAALLLAACGGDDDDGGEAAGSDGNGGGAAAAGTEIDVSMIDFGYDPATLELTAGQPVTINLSNDGEAPHTFTIDDVVDSGNVGGGESTTLEFTPSEAGELSFYCTIHGAEVMSGTITVQ